MKKSYYLVVILCALSLLGCQKKLGKGILYWSPDDGTIQTGSSLIVYSESTITNSFLVSSQGSKEKVEIESWRVGLYTNDQEFKNAFEEFSEYSQSFVSCQRNLPLRESPSASSKNIYKLWEDQELKVISRGKEKVQIGSFEGYWYQLLTEDGVMGYTFDYYLTVYNKSPNGEKEVINARLEEDIHLDSVVDTLWRPDYFQAMINGKMIDMNSFRDQYKFFINGETNTIYLRTAERELSEVFEKISDTGYMSYAFLGTTFRIEIYNDSLISVQYNFEGREYKEAFVRLAKTVDELLVEAQGERDEQLFALIDDGPLYSSQSYGELEIQEGGRFNWSKKTALISRKVVSSAAGNTGRISFNLFPDNSIEDKYDGGMTLTFSNGEKLYLLFVVKENGIQLLNIPSRYVNNLSVVTTDDFYDPITMFFSSPQTGGQVSEQPFNAPQF